MSVIPDLATLENVIFPPGDLYSDEPPLETDLHRLQMTLLIQCLEWLWRNRNDFYASGNLTIYYSPRQRKSENFRGPDFFVVLGTERKPRKSWVVWEEDGKYPNLIIEILFGANAIYLQEEPILVVPLFFSADVLVPTPTFGLRESLQ